MNSDMNSPAGQESTGTATHPPTAAVTAARAAANEAAGKAGLEAVQTHLPYRVLLHHGNVNDMQRSQQDHHSLAQATPRHQAMV